MTELTRRAALAGGFEVGTPGARAPAAGRALAQIGADQHQRRAPLGVRERRAEARSARVDQPGLAAPVDQHVAGVQVGVPHAERVHLRERLSQAHGQRVRAPAASTRQQKSLAHPPPANANPHVQLRLNLLAVPSAFQFIRFALAQARRDDTGELADLTANHLCVCRNQRPNRNENNHLRFCIGSQGDTFRRAIGKIEQVRNPRQNIRVRVGFDRI